jgi:hypothetical protein
MAEELRQIRWRRRAIRAGVMVDQVRTAVEPVTVSRAGELIESETTASAVGPNVVVVSTAVPALGVIVRTTYVGARDADTVAVDLTLGPRPRALNEPRLIPPDSVPVTHAREQCLLDHARQVMNALRAHDGHRYAVHVSDDAVERAASL